MAFFMIFSISGLYVLSISMLHRRYPMVIVWVWRFAYSDVVWVGESIRQAWIWFDGVWIYSGWVILIWRYIMVRWLDSRIMVLSRFRNLMFLL